MHFGLLPQRAAAAASWPPAGGGLRAFVARLPAGWAYAQLQTLARVAFLQQLRSAWDLAGRPAAMPMSVAEHRPRGCASRCCARHNALGTGAYLLSAHGLNLTRAWWPLRELAPPASAAALRAGSGGHASTAAGAADVALDEPRACWSLPEAGCESGAPSVRASLRRSAPTGRGQASHGRTAASSSTAAQRERSAGAEPSNGSALWAGLKLKPSLVADHCLSRVDKNGPPLTPREAAIAWAARRPRETAALRKVWQPFVATPPFVLGERAEEWAAGEPARLHAKGQWLALTLERGERFVAAWWQAIR